MHVATGPLPRGADIMRESWVVVGSVSCNRLAITEQEEEEEDWMLEYQDLNWRDECDEEVGER